MTIHSELDVTGRTKYGRHIGRVGALAVALGVAGALGTSPGIARADEPSTSTEAPSDSAATDGSPTSAGSPDPTDPNPVPATSETAESSDGADPQQTVSESDDDDDPGQTQTESTPSDGVVVRSSGGALTSSAYTSEVEPDAVVDIADEPDINTGEFVTAATEPDRRNDTVDVTPDPVDLDTNAPAVTFAHSHTHGAAEDDQPITVAHAPVDPAAPAPRLPALSEVITQVRTAVTELVTQCLCAVVNQVTSFVSSIGNPTAPATPAPAQAPVAWTVLAWVRRQVDYAVAAFNRSPVGVFTSNVVDRISKEFIDFTNSPFGREVSSRIAQFLSECEGSTELPAEFDRNVVISGLSEPTDFASVTDPSDPSKAHRILVIEKSGTIKVFNPSNGALTDLTRLSVVTSAGERGLIGIEVDPRFWTAGDTEPGHRTIYIAYTGADNRDRLSSLVVNDAFNGVTETELAVSDQLSNEFHHGGELAFDPDGEHLYWAVGNNTVNETSQSLTTIHGKILRINRDGSAAEGNPFAGDPAADARIFALGFRNPFRMAFTPDGHLLAGDVGENTWEELNVVTAGANYGWPGAEGSCAPCGFVDPLYAYRHSDAPSNAGSITAVAVYSGATFPDEYRGRVFIADYSVGWIRELTFDSEYTSLLSERTFDSGAGAVVKLAQGPDGNLYQLNIYPGTLSVMAPSGGNRTPTAEIGADTTSGLGTTLNVQFSGAGSSDPDGDALQYQWDFGNGTTSSELNPTATFTNSGDFTKYTVTLTVSDGEKQNTATQLVVVGATPPSAGITVSNGKYDAGDTITFEGTAFDHRNQPLPDSAYEWSVAFHHADHVHPFLDGVVGPTGSITVPRDYDQLYNTYYRIALTVTDRSGLKTTEFVDVTPNLVTLTFGSNDPDATYTIDGLPYKGQHSEQVVVGVRRTLGAPTTQLVRDGRQLVFVGWSDGGAQTHVIVTPATDTTYQAIFDEAPSAL